MCMYTVHHDAFLIFKHLFPKSLIFIRKYYFFYCEIVWHVLHAKKCVKIKFYSIFSIVICQQRVSRSTKYNVTKRISLSGVKTSKLKIKYKRLILRSSKNVQRDVVCAILRFRVKRASRGIIHSTINYYFPSFGIGWDAVLHIDIASPTGVKWLILYRGYMYM